MVSNHCERAEKTRAEGMARMRVRVWGGTGIGESFSVSKVPKDAEEGVELEEEEEVTSNTTIQLSYKSIGEYWELPSIHAALESAVSPITARMLTLMALDAAADMGKGRIFSELMVREEVEKEETDGVCTGGSGYTSLMFSGASKRAIWRVENKSSRYASQFRGCTCA